MRCVKERKVGEEGEGGWRGRWVRERKPPIARERLRIFCLRTFMGIFDW